MAPQLPSEIDSGVTVDDHTGSTPQEKVIEQYGPPSTNGHTTVHLDSGITFETYHWWARRARENEKHIPANAGLTGLLQVISGRSTKIKPSTLTDANQNERDVDTKKIETDEKAGNGQVKTTFEAQNGTPIQSLSRYGVSEEEWETAQRAARTASWGAIFYLITTDVLGPFVIPWAFAVSFRCSAVGMLDVLLTILIL